MPYAFRISARTVLFVAVNLPPGRIIEGERISPDLFGFTDATSNDSAANGCAWALAGGAWNRPIATGTPAAAKATMDSKSLRSQLRLLPTRAHIIRSIRSLRSEPVMPETQTE